MNHNPMVLGIPLMGSDPRNFLAVCLGAKLIDSSGNSDVGLERVMRLTKGGVLLVKLAAEVDFEAFRSPFGHTIDIERAKMKIGMANLTYNFIHLARHEGKRAPA